MIIILRSRKSENMPASSVWTLITTMNFSILLKKVLKLHFRVNGNLANLQAEPFIIIISRVNSYKRSILVMITIDNCISMLKILNKREMKKSTSKNKRRSKRPWRKSKSLTNSMRNCKFNSNSRFLLSQHNRSNRHLPSRIKPCNKI